MRAVIIAAVLTLTVTDAASAVDRHWTTKLSGVVSPLAAKASEITARCGSRVISGVRRTYVAGTRRVSLHASGHAVDMAGNPSCIYAMLRDWPGGYTTDYARVRHVHISYGGGEHGRRFTHATARSNKRRWRPY